jgi:precorrin-3B synthase
MLAARELRALADAARLGSDIVELTSRAGVQIRGLPARAGEPLERVLAAGGLLPSSTHDRVRNILASPLGGRHARALAETDRVVGLLDRAICAAPRLAGLSGRFVFEIDDASRIGRTLTPDPGGRRPPPDVTLRAVPAGPSGESFFRLVLAGQSTDLRRSSTAAPGLAVAAATAFVDVRDELAADAWHIAEVADAPAEIAARLGGRLDAVDDDQVVRQPSAVGITEQPDGRHAVCGLARLGRLDGRQLDGLADLSRRPADVRVSPWKTITIVDVPVDESAATAAALTALGFVVSPGSPWVGLTACAGLGACASSQIDVRRLAAARAAGGRTGETEHWSGCERRCGEPAAATITVGPTRGRIAVEIDGARDVVATPGDALASLAAAGR